MNIEQIALEMIEAENAARKKRHDLLSAALADGRTDLFTLNMRAVRTMAGNGGRSKRKLPRN